MPFNLRVTQIRGYNFNKSADSETVRQIKVRFSALHRCIVFYCFYCDDIIIIFYLYQESLCYVGYDLKVETQLSQETTVLTYAHQQSLSELS